jgi:hypothetical protein
MNGEGWLVSYFQDHELWKLFSADFACLVDRLDQIKEQAGGDRAEPSTKEILESFFPSL